MRAKPNYLLIRVGYYINRIKPLLMSCLYNILTFLSTLFNVLLLSFS